MSTVVLLTGASGFLGAQIARRLIQKADCKIIALIRAEEIGRAGERLLLAVLTREQRAHRGERSEYLGVGAPGREPGGDEAGPVRRDGGDAGLPVGEGGLALGADLVRGEDDDEHGAGDEGGDVKPGDALAAGGPALVASPLPARASVRHASRIGHEGDRDNLSRGRRRLHAGRPARRQTWLRSISSLGSGSR